VTGPRTPAGGGPTAEFVEAALSHLDSVYRLARHLAPAGCNPEDLVQETFVRALDAAPREDVRDVRAWLLTICLNVVRNEARWRSRHPEQLVGLGDGHEFGAGPASRSTSDPRLATEADPARLAELGERRRAVGRALARLAAPQRDAIVLMDVVGCTARETAELLGCPRGTVLASVHRGRRRLATLLESEGIDDDL
jgi:RNA polymerase sigma-70 factor (ECF subfamily)